MTSPMNGGRYLPCYFYIVAGNPILVDMVLFLSGLIELDNVSGKSMIAECRSRAGFVTAFYVIRIISGIASLISLAITFFRWPT